MQSPDQELGLAVIAELDELLNHPDTLHTTVEHSEQELVSIELLRSLLIAAEPEPQLEDVICHVVDNDALIVTDLVLHGYDSEVLVVSIEQVSQLVHLVVELALLEFADATSV